MEYDFNFTLAWKALLESYVDDRFVGEPFNLVWSHRRSVIVIHY